MRAPGARCAAPRARTLVAPILATLGLGAFGPGPAGAEPHRPVPDSAQMAGLRHAIAGARMLLVRADDGSWELRRARLDSSGVWSESWEAAARARPALIVADRAQTPAVRRIAWDDISSLATQRPRKLRGAVVGAALGLAVTVVVLGTAHGKYHDETWGPGLLVGPMVTGALIGTFVGSGVGTRTIYRSEDQETH